MVRVVILSQCLLIVLTGLGNANLAYGQGRAGGRNQPAQGLSATQVEWLRTMREEEKLARDVYRQLGLRSGMQIFGNISDAESKHMSAMAQILTRYQIPDPLQSDKTGVFPSAKFQQHYQQLVKTGSASPVAALQVGLEIEEMDIVDLQRAIATGPPADIQQVLGNLQRASRNHLRAFARQLQAAGGTYRPSHLSADEFNRIASSAQEPGGPQGGAGQRGGQGGSGRGPGAGGRGQGAGGQGAGGQGGGGGRGGKGRGRGRDGE